MIIRVEATSSLFSSRSRYFPYSKKRRCSWSSRAGNQMEAAGTGSSQPANQTAGLGSSRPLFFQPFSQLHLLFVLFPASLYLASQAARRGAAGQSERRGGAAGLRGHKQAGAELASRGGRICGGATGRERRRRQADGAELERTRPRGSAGGGMRMGAGARCRRGKR